MDLLDNADAYLDLFRHQEEEDDNGNDNDDVDVRDTNERHSNNDIGDDDNDDDSSVSFGPDSISSSSSSSSDDEDTGDETNLIGGNGFFGYGNNNNSHNNEEEEDIGHQHRYDGHWNGRRDAVDKDLSSADLAWQVGEDERTKRKDRLHQIILTLTETLEQTDPKLHAQAVARLEDCKKKNEDFKLGYEYLATIMRTVVKDLLAQNGCSERWQTAESDLADKLEAARKEKENKEGETRKQRHFCRDPGFSPGGWGGRMDMWNQSKTFSLLVRVLAKYIGLQEHARAQAQTNVHQEGLLQQKAIELVRGALKEYDSSRKSMVDQDIAKKKLKEILSGSDSHHWNVVEKWTASFEEVINQDPAGWDRTAQSVAEAQSTLQSLPDDPISQVMLDQGTKILLRHDPTVPVVKLFVERASRIPACDIPFLHYAASGGASLKVLRYLAEKFPDALTTFDEDGCLPLHQFLLHHKYMKKKGETKKVLAVVETIVSAAPDTLSIPQKSDGQLPLHLVFDLIEHRQYSPSGFLLAEFLMERYPQALNVPARFLGFLPLQQAIYRKGPLELLQRMVELAPHSSRSVSTRSGELPLHTALNRGEYFELARILLTKNGLRNQGTRSGGTWCSFAWKNCDERHREQMKLFLEDCQDLLDPEEFQEWLYVQVNHTSQDTDSVLLDIAPPSVLSWVLNHRDKSGLLILEKDLSRCEAAVNTRQIKRLVQHDPTSVKSTGSCFCQTPLHTAVANDNFEAVRIILTANHAATSQPDKYGRLPLHIAIIAGARLGILKLLIDAYPAALWTPDSRSYTPLHHTFHVNPEKVGWWAPSCGCKKGRLSHAGIKYLMGVVKVLVCHHDGGQRALWMADESGRLPLHHAVTDDGRVVNFLLDEMGPRACQFVDSTKRLVLHVALESQASYPTMHVILHHHNAVQLEQPDGRRRLPLLVACESDCPMDVVYLLLRSAPNAVRELLRHQAGAQGT